MFPFNLKEALESGIAVTGCPGSGKTTLLKHIAQHLILNGVVCYVIDVSKAWPTNTPIDNTIVVTGEQFTCQRKNTVFDISKLSYDDKQKWVIECVRALYEQHVNGYSQQEFIIFEECQIYLPTGALRGNAFAPIKDLITVGRNFSLRYALATQFPAMVDANALKSPQQRYFGWTTEANDVSRVRSYFPRKRKNELEETLRDLGKLQFLYQYGNTILPFKIGYYSPPVNVPLESEAPNPIKVNYAWQPTPA